MNTIKQLIEKYCPEGVECKKLGEVFNYFSGMTGVSGKWKDSGNCKFIDYLNVYNNMRVDVSALRNATVSNMKQNVLKKHDILLTCASETPDECALSSVIRDDIADNTFLDDHLFAIRVKQEYKDIVDTAYFNYYFHSVESRKAVNKTVRGVTRFYISYPSFMRIEIPLPPIEVQREIVRILDNFTSLEAELEAELEARRKQYEYYRDQLLSFKHLSGGGRSEVVWKTLGEMGTFIRGNGLQKKDFTESGFPCIHYGQIHTTYNTFTDKTVSYTSLETAKHLKKANTGDLLIATTSEDVDACCKAVAWLGNTECAISGDSYIYRHTQDPKYMAYLFQTDMFAKQKKTAATGTKVIRVSGDSMAKFKFPIPPLSVQHHIVSILDRFESLVNDITTGLPAEIAARHQQYEYYRDQLLTFKRKS